MKVNLKDDIRLAQNARKNAFLKTGEYAIGAVIKTKSGRRYTGCNIEVSTSEMIWAEKVALEKAISEGEKEFEYILVIGGNKNQETEKYLPCEECKKFINIFVDEDFKKMFECNDINQNVSLFNAIDIQNVEYLQTKKTVFDLLRDDKYNIYFKEITDKDYSAINLLQNIKQDKYLYLETSSIENFNIVEYETTT